MKYLILFCAFFSVAAFAHPSNSLHYVNNKGQIVYNNSIQPEVSHKTIFKNGKKIEKRITKYCVRVSEHRNHMTCRQWDKSVEKRVIGNRRQHDYRNHGRNDRENNTHRNNSKYYNDQ